MNDRVDIAALRRERDELRDELERRTMESRMRPAPARRARRPWSTATKMFVVGAALIVIASGALAVVALFSHNFPAYTGVAAVLTTTCGVGTGNSLTANNAVAGTVFFNCGATTPALSSAAGGGSATPAFTLPSGFSDIDLIPSASASSTINGCSTVAGGHPMTSGIAIVFTAATGPWDYCLDYVAGASTTGFSVSWSQ